MSIADRVLNAFRPGEPSRAREIAGRLNLTPVQVSGALTQLKKQGRVHKGAKLGEWFLTPTNLTATNQDTRLAFAKQAAPKQVTPVFKSLDVGDLCEVVGYTAAGTLVLRHLDSGLLVPVKLHTAVAA